MMFTWVHNLFSKVKLAGFGSKRFKTLKEAEEACEKEGIKLVFRKRNHEEESIQKSNKCLKRPSTRFSATHSSGQSSSTGQSTSGASNVWLMVIRILILLRGRSSDYVATMEWVMAMPGMLESLPNVSWAALLSMVAWTCLYSHCVCHVFVKLLSTHYQLVNSLPSQSFWRCSFVFFDLWIWRRYYNDIIMYYIEFI